MSPLAGRVGRLHVLTDEKLQRRWSHEDLALAAARGGADVVQYRDKRVLARQARIKVAGSIVAALRPTPACCIVNDDPEVAFASAAAGIHLGRHDGAPDQVRRRAPLGFVIGATANDLREAESRAAEAVDYLGVGPVFGTRSKADPAPRLGLAELRRIVSAVDKPVIAIGGIDAANAREVLDTGVWGIAVLGAVAGHADPREATAELRAIVDAWVAAEVHG
jgi:thiamine-phosphate pyrophosphorylase